MIAAPTVRLAQTADAAAIAEFSRDFIEHGLAWTYTPARIALAIHSRTANVASIGNTRLHAFGIMDYQDTSAHLGLFGVYAAARRKGLGRHLFEWLQLSAVNAGIALIKLEARVDNTGGIAFYERLGFTVGQRIPGYYSGIVDAMRMEKRLGAFA